MWNCIGHLGPLHSFAVVSPFIKGEGSVMYKSLRASKSYYVKRQCLVVPLVSRQ